MCLCVCVCVKERERERERKRKRERVGGEREDRVFDKDVKTSMPTEQAFYKDFKFSIKNLLRF